MSTTKYEVPQQQVKALPGGASTHREAAIMNLQNNNATQNSNNQALAKGGRRKRGGGMQAPVVRAPYNETAYPGVQQQSNNNIKANIQNQENQQGDAGAFKGGKRRNKSRKSGKRKTKRHRTRKHRK